GQTPMPDRDHSIEFWRQVAGRFKTSPGVVFELHNEPFPDGNQDTISAWTCWRDGGNCPGLDYAAAGMQELVDAVRAAGADNLVLLGGVQYSDALGRWREYGPRDAAGNLGAAGIDYHFH